jgi:hypothetical protein
VADGMPYRVELSSLQPEQVEAFLREFIETDISTKPLPETTMLKEPEPETIEVPKQRKPGRKAK